MLHAIKEPKDKEKCQQHKKKKKKNHKIIATTLHMTNYEWWRLVGSPLLTHHVANCDKSCGIFYVPSIAKGKIKDRIPISV